MVPLKLGVGELSGVLWEEGKAPHMGPYLTS